MVAGLAVAPGDVFPRRILELNQRGRQAPGIYLLWVNTALFLLLQRRRRRRKATRNTGQECFSVEARKSESGLSQDRTSRLGITNRQSMIQVPG